MQKGREIWHCSLWKYLEGLTGAFYGCEKYEKTSCFSSLFIFRRPGIIFYSIEKNAAFSTILRKGYHLSMKGIRMCYLFWQKWYCWFSVSRLSKLIEVKIKTVQWKKSRICKEMKGGKYEKNLAKIQDREMFHIRDIRRNVLPKFTEICMKTPCWCPTGWAQFGGRKPTKTSVTAHVLLQNVEFIARRTHKTSK